MAAAAISQKRNFWMDWRAETNMGRNLGNFFKNRKCYVITIVKKSDLAEAKPIQLPRDKYEF